MGLKYVEAGILAPSFCNCFLAISICLQKKFSNWKVILDGKENWDENIFAYILGTSHSALDLCPELPWHFHPYFW